MEKGIYNYRAPLCKAQRPALGDTVVLDLDGTERPYRIEAIVNAWNRPCGGRGLEGGFLLHPRPRSTSLHQEKRMRTAAV